MSDLDLHARDLLLEQFRFTDGWVQAHLPLFTPFPAGAAGNRELHRKSFCELALYYDIVGDDSSPVPAAVLDHVCGLVNDDRYASLIRRSPENLTTFGFPVLLADKHGRLSARTRRAVDAVLAEPTVWAVERPPFRTLDLWHLCVRLGARHRIDVGATLRHSNLQHAPQPCTTSPTQIYGYTHNVFYLTDFGRFFAERAPTAAIPPQSPAMLTALILRFVAEDNLDLALELVMAGANLRQLPLAVAVFVLNRLLLRLNEEQVLRSPVSSMAEQFAGPGAW